MEIFIKVNLKMIKEKEKVKLFIIMEIFMKENLQIRNNKRKRRNDLSKLYYL